MRSEEGVGSLFRGGFGRSSWLGCRRSLRLSHCLCPLHCQPRRIYLSPFAFIFPCHCFTTSSSNSTQIQFLQIPPVESKERESRYSRQGAVLYGSIGNTRAVAGMDSYIVDEVGRKRGDAKPVLCLRSIFQQGLILAPPLF